MTRWKFGQCSKYLSNSSTSFWSEILSILLKSKSFCLRQTAKEFGKYFDPIVSNIVLNNFYVDDSLFSVDQGQAIYGPWSRCGPLVPAKNMTIVCMDINFH